LARKYAVDQWVLPALSELCERPQPLKVDEARLMNFEDIVLVGSVRESVRSHMLSVNPVKPAEIKDCIEAWKKGEPWSPAKVPDPSVEYKSGFQKGGRWSPVEIAPGPAIEYKSGSDREERTYPLKAKPNRR
jgi:hypothetical protein